MQLILIPLAIVAGIAGTFGAMKPLNKEKCVEWHNYYRKMHQAPDVKWSDTLAAEAQSWADNLARRNAFQHGSTGENLYKSSGDSDNACENAIKAFYSEEPFYNYEAAKYVPKAGHFTQVVWVGSTEIGVGKAKTNSGAIILVFRYKPAGNFIGQFKENVKPKVSGGEAITHLPSHYTFLLCAFSLFVLQNLL